LSERIRHYHERSDRTYGVPRIHRVLADEGARVGRKRVARLMRQQGLKGVTRRKGFRTTRRDDDARPAPDLVDRNFTATKPDQLWVADITFIPTWAGFLFLAVVIDVFSRRVVGWSMAGNLKTQLVMAALDMALMRRRPNGVIHHSDQGCQYTSVAFGERCRKADIRASMGAVGDCYDSALCESCFASLECELLDRYRFRNHEEARMAVFLYLQGWYNPHRRHSSIDYISPMAYENKYKLSLADQRANLSTKPG